MSEQIIFFGPSSASKPFALLRPTTLTSVGKASAEFGVAGLWIVAHLRPDIVNFWSSTPTQHRDLLLLERVAEPRLEVLHTLFRRVVIKQRDVAMLPDHELAEALADENAQDLFIGGRVVPEDEVIVLYRGNLAALVAPFATFRPSGAGTTPDFKKFVVTDYGQTIQLGKYEAASDAVLYELDSDYRRRAKKKRLAQDDSLGACLKRLRLQKGLRLSDFPGVTDKEVGRIERGDVRTPHRETLEKIAKRLGVTVEEIASY